MDSLLLLFHCDIYLCLLFLVDIHSFLCWIFFLVLIWPWPKNNDSYVFRHFWTVLSLKFTSFFKGIPQLPCAKALYNYEGKEPGDLKFSKGDIIILRRQVDENWYHGEVNGIHGFFPTNFVQIIKPLPQPPPQCKALYDFEVKDKEADKDCLPFAKVKLEWHSLFSACQLFFFLYLNTWEYGLNFILQKDTIILCELYHCAFKNIWKQSSLKAQKSNFVLGLFYMKDNFGWCFMWYHFHI